MHYYSLGGARKGIDGALIASRPRHNRFNLNSTSHDAGNLHRGAPPATKRRRLMLKAAWILPEAGLERF
jgi:hypothetical protein